MKNTTSTAILLLWSLIVFGQQNPLNVHLDHNLNENSGNIFDVEVRLSDFVDLYTFQLFMTWDSTIYRIDGVSYINEDIPSFKTENIVLPANDQNLPTKGKVRIIWGDAATLSLPENTHIATLRFSAIGEPCEHSSFKFENIGTEESEKLLAADASFNNIGIAADDMTIQIPGVGCLSSNEALEQNIEVAIYPIPAKDFVNIDITGTLSTNAQITIVALDGQLISKSPIANNKTQIDLSTLQAGTYLYEIQDQQQVVKQGKLLKVN